MKVFDAFVETQMAETVWACFWFFYSISLVHISVFFQHHAGFVSMALLYNLESVLFFFAYEYFDY
jgi:hypothetical protein